MPKPPRAEPFALRGATAPERERAIGRGVFEQNHEVKRIRATGPINRDNFEVDVSELPVLFYARLLADGGLFLFGFQDCCPQTSCGVEITLTGFYDAGGKDLFLRTVLDMWRQELE